MKIMSSGEFRKGYARLTEGVIVTVNGHPIGVWIPRTISPDGITVWPDDDWWTRSQEESRISRASSVRVFGETATAAVAGPSVVLKVNRG